MEKDNKNLLIIDADSIVYIVGYDLKDMQLAPLGFMKLDEFITSMLITNYTQEYIGFYGGPGGRNYRKDLAITKEYKGNRKKDKEPWYEFWEPILKERMRDHWGFQPCLNIEADDACNIAVEKYRDVYEKVIVASPDKDLLQIGDCWFYDYIKRTTVFCPYDVAKLKLCAQAITGDSTDNIPGLSGAGPAVAQKVALEIQEKGLEFDDAIEAVRDFYVEWHTVTLLDKQIKKQEKEYLKKYREDNNIKSLRKDAKSTALESFVVDTSMILTEDQALVFFKEQYGLVKLLASEEEGLEHDFTMSKPLEATMVDWHEVIMPGSEDILAEDELISDEYGEFLNDL